MWAIWEDKESCEQKVPECMKNIEKKKKMKNNGKMHFDQL